jgi:hypothetical protein
MSSEVEELWHGLEELDAVRQTLFSPSHFSRALTQVVRVRLQTFQRQTEDAQADRDALRTVMQTLEGTKLDAIWPALERTEQAAIADRAALRGLMEMVRF